MPLTTETTEDFQGIVHIGTGVVTGRDIIGGSAAALLLVRNTRNFHYEFVDLSAAESVVVSNEELEQVLALDRLAAVYRPQAIVVLVAPSDDALAVAKEWERRVEPLGWSTHIARERGAALDWLHAHLPPSPRAELEAGTSAASSAENAK